MPAVPVRRESGSVSDPTAVSQEYEQVKNKLAAMEQAMESTKLLLQKEQGMRQSDTALHAKQLDDLQKRLTETERTAAAARAAFEAEIAHLREKSAGADASVAAAESERRAQYETLSALETAHAAERSARSSAETTNAELQAKLSAAEQTGWMEGARRVAAEKARDEIQARLRNAEEKHRTADSARQTAERQRDEMRTRLADMETLRPMAARATAAEARVTELEAELSRMKQQAAEVAATTSAPAGDTRVDSEHMAALSAKLAALEEQLSVSNARVLVLQHDNRELQAFLAAAGSPAGAGNRQLADLLKAKETLELQVESMKAQVHTQMALIQSADRALENQLQDQRAMEARHSKQIAEMETGLRAAHRTLTAYEQRVASLEGAAKNAGELQSQLAQLQEQLSAATVAREEADTRARALAEQVRRLECELDAARTTGGTTIAAANDAGLHEARAADLEVQCKQLRAALDAAETEARVHRASAEAAQQQRQAAEAAAQRLQEQLDTQASTLAANRATRAASAAASDAAATNAALELRASPAESDAKEAMERLHSAEERIAQLQREVEHFASQSTTLDTLNAELAAAQQSVASAESTIRSRDTQIERLQEQLDQADRKLKFLASLAAQPSADASTESQTGAAEEGLDDAAPASEPAPETHSATPAQPAGVPAAEPSQLEPLHVVPGSTRVSEQDERPASPPPQNGPAPSEPLRSSATEQAALQEKPVADADAPQSEPSGRATAEAAAAQPSASRQQPVLQWTPEQVADWLQGQEGGLRKYAPAFLERRITGAQLLSLDPNAPVRCGGPAPAVAIASAHGPRADFEGSRCCLVRAPHVAS